MTYGDCLSNINIRDMVSFAEKQDKLITMAVACPTGRNNVVGVGEGDVLETMNPSTGGSVNAWTNACTYVFRKKIFRFLNGSYELDKQLLPELAEKSRSRYTGIMASGALWRPCGTRWTREPVERGDRAVEGVDGMKVVIPAGGMGTRISEESRFKPKPMVEIGDRPILWHIMKWYASLASRSLSSAAGIKAM